MVKLRCQDFRVKHSLTVMDDALSSLKTKPVLGPGTPIPGPFLLCDTLKGERSVLLAPVTLSRCELEVG